MHRKHRLEIRRLEIRRLEMHLKIVSPSFWQDSDAKMSDTASAVCHHDFRDILRGLLDEVGNLVVSPLQTNDVDQAESLLLSIEKL